MHTMSSTSWTMAVTIGSVRLRVHSCLFVALLLVLVQPTHVRAQLHLIATISLPQLLDPSHSKFNQMGLDATKNLVTLNPYPFSF